MTQDVRSPAPEPALPTEPTPETSTIPAEDTSTPPTAAGSGADQSSTVSRKQVRQKKAKSELPLWYRRMKRQRAKENVGKPHMEAPQRPTRRPEWLLPMDDDLRPRLDRTSTGWQAGTKKSVASSSCTDSPKTDSAVSPAAYKPAVPVAAQQTQLILLFLSKCWPRSKPKGAPLPCEGQTWSYHPPAGGTMASMLCLTSHRQPLPNYHEHRTSEPCCPVRPFQRDDLSQLYPVCSICPHSGPGALTTLKQALNLKYWQAGLSFVHRPSAPGLLEVHRCMCHRHPGVVRPPCTSSSIPAGSSKDTIMRPIHGLSCPGVPQALAASWDPCLSCIFIHCPLPKGWTDCYQSSDTCAVCTRSGPLYPQWSSPALLSVAMTGPRGPRRTEPGYISVQERQASSGDQDTTCRTCGGSNTPTLKANETTSMPKVRQPVQPCSRWSYCMNSGLSPPLAAMHRGMASTYPPEFSLPFWHDRTDQAFWRTTSRIQDVRAVGSTIVPGPVSPGTRPDYQAEANTIKCLGHSRRSSPRTPTPRLSWKVWTRPLLKGTYPTFHVSNIIFLPQSHSGPNAGARHHTLVVHLDARKSVGVRVTSDCHSLVEPKVPIGSDGKPRPEQNKRHARTETAHDGSLLCRPLPGLLHSPTSPTTQARMWPGVWTQLSVAGTDPPCIDPSCMQL